MLYIEKKSLVVMLCFMSKPALETGIFSFLNVFIIMENIIKHAQTNFDRTRHVLLK